MILRKFKNKDTKNVASLVGDTFAMFNSKEGDKKAIRNYIEFYKTNDIDKVKKIFAKSTIFFVAVDNGKIVGMVRGNSNRIFNLFVLGSYHKKGIGTKLLNKFEMESKKNKSNVIKIRSSLFAFNFYKKMGYKKSTGIRLFKGIKVHPMKKIIT